MSTKDLLVYFVITFIASFLAISLALSLKFQFVDESDTKIPSQIEQPALPEQ